MKKFFVLVMVLFIGAFAFGQGTNQGDVLYSATVAQTSVLTVAVNGDVVYTDLRPGVSYKCIADAVVNNTNITPFIAETFEPAEVEIDGEPGLNVVLTFILPTQLLPTDGIGVINMSYDNQSANWFDDVQGISNFFNPASPFTITIPTGGAALIYLGGNPNVSNDATTGVEFLGYALVVAEYTGQSL